jgi:putative ABC transport system permease protein
MASRSDRRATRRGRRHPGVQRSVLAPRDLIGEALAGILQRPARSALTTLGTVLGLAAFVAILGLTATAGGQIDKRFTVQAATEVVVEDVGSGESHHDISFPADAGTRIAGLNGVVDAGVWWPVPLPDPQIAAAPDVSGPGAGRGSGVGVVAAEPGALAAMEPTLATGRLYDRFHQSRTERVAVLGIAAAGQLGIGRLDALPAVFINQTPYTVVGILDDVRRRPELLLSIVIPASTALADFGPPTEQRAAMLIRTRLGAAGVVARQAATALRPEAPELFKVAAPPDPKSLRRNVTGDLNSLFLLLATVSLIIGAVGIANTTLVAVLERTGEIGLRRALGARRRHIAAQFLTESAALGTLGGLAGTSVGVVTVVAVAVAQRWTALLPPWAVVAAPLIGVAVGLLAGLYPALRAASIEPVEAFRR